MTSPVFAIEDDLRAAIALTRLADWINSAQATLDHLEVAVTHDAELAAILKRRAIFSPADTPHGGAGLAFLQSTILGHLRGIERSAGLASHT